MSPARFVGCLIPRWTPINLASALQRELSWIEAMEASNEPITDERQTRLEALAEIAQLPPVRSFRGRRWEA